MQRRTLPVALVVTSMVVATALVATGIAVRVDRTRCPGTVCPRGSAAFCYVPRHLPWPFAGGTTRTAPTTRTTPATRAAPATRTTPADAWTYDAERARYLADLCERAYVLLCVPRAFSLPAALTPLGVLEARDDWRGGRVLPFGFVAERAGAPGEPPALVVAFRGTVTPAEWLDDLRERLVPASAPPPPGPSRRPPSETVPASDALGAAAGEVPGAVHAGFACLYGRMAACLHALVDGWLAAHAADGGTVLVTGHSLGAALATLCAADLAARGAPVACYTFASPRVGNRTFAAWLGRVALPGRLFRVFNTEDLIPTLPMATGRTLYEHAGAPLAFTDNAGSLEENHALATYYPNAPRCDACAPAPRIAPR